MAADCNCSNPSCPCYKGNQDKAGEQQAPGPDAPSTQSSNGSTHGGNQVTSAEASNGGGNIEVTNTQALRVFYGNVRDVMTELHESSTVAAAELQQHAQSFEQSTGFMSTEEFPEERIGLATQMQDITSGLAEAVGSIAATAGELVTTAQSAIDDSIENDVPLEELLAGGGAKHTAAYMGG